MEYQEEKQREKQSNGNTHSLASKEKEGWIMELLSRRGDRDHSKEEAKEMRRKQGRRRIKGS